MAEAWIKREINEQRVTVSADTNPGAILQADDGRAGIVQGDRVVANGDVAVLDCSPDHEYRANADNVNASFNPSAGDPVGWDSDNDEYVSADSADANFYLGVATTSAGGAGNSFRFRPNRQETVAITDNSGGTADGTVAAVSGSGDDGTINNNFAEIVTALKNANIMN